MAIEEIFALLVPIGMLVLASIVKIVETIGYKQFLTKPAEYMEVLDMRCTFEEFLRYYACNPSRYIISEDDKFFYLINPDKKPPIESGKSLSRKDLSSEYYLCGGFETNGDRRKYNEWKTEETRRLTDIKYKKFESEGKIKYLNLVQGDIDKIRELADMEKRTAIDFISTEKEDTDGIVLQI